MQRASDEPVGWDPCQPIRYQVNPEGAPDGGDELIDRAVERISTATGLVFESEGTTDNRPFTAQFVPVGTDRLGGSTVSQCSDCWTDSDSFEPRDAVKGDVARMLFYMAIRYEGDDGYVNLELNNSINGSTFEMRRNDHPLDLAEQSQPVHRPPGVGDGDLELTVQPLFTGSGRV